MNFDCDQCYDTECIDRGGAEIPCPYCVKTVKITGLAHGLGNRGSDYRTAVSFGASTITFQGTARAILAEAVRVRRNAEADARLAGRKGRNAVSSGAIAIENHIRKALAS